MFQLYPPPTSIRQRKGSLARTGRKCVRLACSADDRLHRAISRFCDATGLSMTHGNAKVAALVTVQRGKEGGHQGYSLACDAAGIQLAAASDAGLYYGLVTLEQILAQCGEQVPFFNITDAPDFTNRGVMLDISRCKVPTMQTLFEMIDDFARLKYNQLQLYTEHTFAFSNHPLIWADASPLTAEETLALQAYCRDRYIELVPNLNSFGHFERWLRYPEYHRYAECPNGFEHPFSHQHIPFGSTLKPDRQSLRLLEELYDEYLPLFESSQFNIGGDEPWELGHGASRKRCEREGTTRVYVDFISKIRKRVKARHRTMMFWSDIVLREPGCLDTLSKDLIAMNWGYEGNHPFKRECQQMADAGLDFYVCPGTSSWNSLTGRTANVQANVANAARNGLATGAVGYLVTDWGDHGHHQYLPISYQGFLLGACHAWNHRASRKLDVADGLDRIYFKDTQGGSGALLVRLGRALELAPSKIRNATIFNRLMFWSMQHEPSVVQSIPDAQLEDCDIELAAIKSALDSIAPARDADLVRAELGNAIDLARHGIHRLQHFRGSRRQLGPLREELALAIGRHEALWLARNRPGGLHESSNHLRTSLAALGAL